MAVEPFADQTVLVPLKKLLKVKSVSNITVLSEWGGECAWRECAGE